MCFFRKSPKNPATAAKTGVKKVDAVVTGVLLGGVIASIYGVKKIREHADKEKQKHINMISRSDVEPKKRSILKRILFGNK